MPPDRFEVVICMLISAAYCLSDSGNNCTIFAFLLKEFKWRNSDISPFSGSNMLMFLSVLFYFQDLEWSS